MLRLLLIISAALAVEFVPVSTNKWDVDGPCQEYVEKLAKAQANMVQCSTNFSIPPKVCTNCIDPYINFKQVEYEMHHLQNVSSRDNRSCTEVIYNSYLLSYSYEISEALSTRIWDNSRCESCMHITWNFAQNDSQVEFLNHTIEFQKLLFSWRECINHYKNFTEKEFSLYEDVSNMEIGSDSICKQCKTQFDKLFTYYWDIYVQPGVDFCVDVETTMNDTFHIWNDVWQCADRKDRERDTLLVVLTSVIMAILIVLFYVSSFIQGGGVRRHLVKYSRLAHPSEPRSRLLSTSNSEASFAPQPAHGSL